MSLTQIHAHSVAQADRLRRSKRKMVRNLLRARPLRLPFTALCLRSTRQKTKPAIMALRAHRRWLCLLMALLFAVSGAAHAYAMTDAAMKMPSAAMESSMSDQSMADHGMDCGGSD